MKNGVNHALAISCTYVLYMLYSLESYPTVESIKRFKKFIPDFAITG